MRGALRYEFQLSTSSAFRDSGIVYSDTSLTSPCRRARADPALDHGSPHALYARVRAVLADTTTPWSAPFGFDMEPAAVPTPLPCYPGLLAGRRSTAPPRTRSGSSTCRRSSSRRRTSLDEREFYCFHQAASWLGQVRWRIRALRNDFNSRANGLPAVAHGAWSPVYASVNPPSRSGR